MAADVEHERQKQVVQLFQGARLYALQARGTLATRCAGYAIVSSRDAPPRLAQVNIDARGEQDLLPVVAVRTVGVQVPRPASLGEVLAQGGQYSVVGWCLTWNVIGHGNLHHPVAVRAQRAARVRRQGPAPSRWPSRSAPTRPVEPLHGYVITALWPRMSVYAVAA